MHSSKSSIYFNDAPASHFVNSKEYKQELMIAKYASLNKLFSGEFFFFQIGRTNFIPDRIKSSRNCCRNAKLDLQLTYLLLFISSLLNHIVIKRSRPYSLCSLLPQAAVFHCFLFLFLLQYPSWSFCGVDSHSQSCAAGSSFYGTN